MPVAAATYGDRGPIAPYKYPPNAGPKTRARLATDCDVPRTVPCSRALAHLEMYPDKVGCVVPFPGTSSIDAADQDARRGTVLA